MHKKTNQPAGQNTPYSKQNDNPTYSKSENILNEPEVIYQNKQEVKHFDSFEEMNEADAKEMAAIPPIIHLQNATLLAKRVFSEDLKKSMDMTIKFR